MIQIIGLRKFTPKDSDKVKVYDAFFDKFWRADSVADLFKNLDKHLEKIPDKERWNIFYTVSTCGDKKREFAQMDTLAFDIDGINPQYIDSYVEVILSALKLDKSKTGIVASGHGLHFLIELKKPIKSLAEIKELKPQYRQLVLTINKAIHRAGLVGTADSSVFDGARILRLPKTINRKPDKPEVLCELMQENIHPQDFDLIEKSGLKPVDKKEQISSKLLMKFPDVDSEAVMEGCQFFKDALEDPNSLSEAAWYAGLSITSRMTPPKDGKEDYWSQEFSKGHKDYDAEETTEKALQAMEASGPRTCANIATISDSCKACEFRGKVTSAILIKGPNSIPTQHTGFHVQPWSGKGKAIPAYDDLRKFFDLQHTYKGLGGSGMVHVFNGKHYEYKEKLFLEQFSEDYFDPKPNNSMAKEFTGKVSRTNLKPLDWWQQTAMRRINFQNGYLDVASNEFRPHDSDKGFRYVLPYDYDEEATCPNFEKMLKLITGGDEDMQNVLLEFMGYCLSNDEPWAHKALVLVGDGANGKSTFINVLRDLAGISNYTSLSMDQINKSEYNRQMLDGKLFNVSEETPTKALMDNSLFKALAAGSEIQVRSPYKEPYFVKTLIKMVFSCNELPESNDNSYGYYRRIILVPFKQTFTKATEGFDPHIHQKLKDELAGIFNLAINGYHRLVKQQGFTSSEEIDAALEEYKYENDSTLNWFMNNMTVQENTRTNPVPIKDIYTSYKYDTEAEGRRALSMQKFSKGIKKKIPDYDERTNTVRINGKPTYCLYNVVCASYQ